jgi:hypothetical protein
MVQLNGNECIPPIDHCKVPNSIQPTGLFKNEEEGVYECSACKDGFAFNADSLHCESCNTTLKGCLKCASLDECSLCR